MVDTFIATECYAELMVDTLLLHSFMFNLWLIRYCYRVLCSTYGAIFDTKTLTLSRTSKEHINKKKLKSGPLAL